MHPALKLKRGGLKEESLPATDIEGYGHPPSARNFREAARKEKTRSGSVVIQGSELNWPTPLESYVRELIRSTEIEHLRFVDAFFEVIDEVIAGDQ